MIISLQFCRLHFSIHFNLSSEKIIHSYSFVARKKPFLFLSFFSMWKWTFKLSDSTPIHDALMAFSLLKNTSALLSTDAPKGAILSINGIRVISITWVTIGHAYIFGISAFGMFRLYFLQPIPLLLFSLLFKKKFEPIFLLFYNMQFSQRYSYIISPVSTWRRLDVHTTSFGRSYNVFTTFYILETCSQLPKNKGWYFASKITSTSWLIEILRPGQSKHPSGSILQRIHELTSRRPSRISSKDN